MLIGEVKESAAQFDGDGLVGVEGVEPDSRTPFFVVDVGAEVQFEKPRKAGNGRAKAGAYTLHREGDDSEVGFVLKGIEMQTGGECGGEILRIEFPMEKEQVGPALPHDR